LKEGVAMRTGGGLLGALLVLPMGLLIGSGLARALEPGDAAHGKKVFAKCQACHSLDAGVNKIGPSLHRIVGRAAAAEADFKYSDAMKNAHLNWTAEALDQYLLNPRKMVPGTKMAFPGLPKEKDRADVIAYLQQAAGASQ
jgi:cytochrome c2